MSEHVAESQPHHPDPGMDAFIKHQLGQNNEPAPDPGEGEEQPEPMAAEAEEAPKVVKEEAPEEQEAASDDEEFDQDPMVPIMVDGIEQEVPLSELMQGYSRQADYTRKTQALAEERRALEAERTQVQREYQDAAQQMTQLTQQLQAQIQANMPNPAELDELRVTNPAEYAARVADQQRQMALLAAAQQQSVAEEQKQMAQRVAESRKALADAEPDFSNDFDGTYAALGRWVTSPEGGNVPLEEWNREYDPRRILIAYRAWKGSEQNAAAKARDSSVRKKVAKLPRVRPAARHEPGQTETANYDAAVERMQSTNSTKDIARALQAREAARKVRRANDGHP